MTIGYISKVNNPPFFQNNVWLIQTVEEIWINPGETKLIHTGLFFDFPKNWTVFIFSYLELVLKKEVIITNAPGIVDSDYRGELCGISTNVSDKRAHLLAGEVFALGLRDEVHQMYSPVEKEENLIQFKLHKRSHKPSYQTDGSAGFDLHASLEEKITLHPGERRIVETNLQVSIPEGFHFQIHSRSGLALKSGIIVLGAPFILQGGQSYMIEIPLYNLSQKPFSITPGMRIAQAICLETQAFTCSSIDQLSTTKRGLGGFGSTGC